jgi:hypothetical protein
MTYFTQLSKQKSGVGLIVDLGKVQEVARVDVRLVGGPTDLELRTAPSDATRAPTGSADDYQVVQRLTGAGPDATFAMDKPVDSRFLLIWLTELPEVSSGSWKSEIAEIKVYG